MQVRLYLPAAREAAAAAVQVLRLHLLHQRREALRRGRVRVRPARAPALALLGRCPGRRRCSCSDPGRPGFQRCDLLEDGDAAAHVEAGAVGQPHAPSAEAEDPTSLSCCREYAAKATMRRLSRADSSRNDSTPVRSMADKSTSCALRSSACIWLLLSRFDPV